MKTKLNGGRPAGPDIDEYGGLTARQYAIYRFIKTLITNRGYGPTNREIMKEFGIKSTNGAQCHLKAIEKKGYIVRERNLARAIKLAGDPLAQRSAR